MLEDVVAVNIINEGMTNKIAPDVNINNNQHNSNKMSSDVLEMKSNQNSTQGNNSYLGNSKYQGNNCCEGNKDMQMPQLEDLQKIDLNNDQNIKEKLDNNSRNVNADDSHEGGSIKHIVQEITKSQDGCVQSVKEPNQIEETKFTDIPELGLTENDRNVNSNTNRKNESIQSEEEHRNKEKEKMKISLERLVDDKKSIPSSEQEINCEDRSVYMVSRKIKLKAENVKETKLLSEELTKGEGITMSSPGMDKTECQFISTQMDHGVERGVNHDDEKEMVVGKDEHNCSLGDKRINNNLIEESEQSIGSTIEMKNICGIELSSSKLKMGNKDVIKKMVALNVQRGKEEVLPGEKLGKYFFNKSSNKGLGEAASIEIALNNVRAKAMADTGAEVSIVQYAMFKRLIYLNAAKKLAENKDLSIVGLGGEEVKVYGITKWKVKINHTVFYFHMLVADFETKHDLILGVDFMYATGIMMDFANRCLHIPEDGNIPFLKVVKPKNWTNFNNGGLRLPREQVRNWIIKEEIKLYPGESVSLEERVKGKVIYVREPWLELYVSRLVRIDGETARITLYNASLGLKTLKLGLIVAILLDEGDLNYYQDCEGGVKYVHENKTDWSRELERIMHDMPRRIRISEELVNNHNKLYQEEEDKRKAIKANLPIPKYDILKKDKLTCRESKTVALLRLKVNLAKFQTNEENRNDDMRELLDMESSCSEEDEPRKQEVPREQDLPREQEIIPTREQLEDGIIIEEDPEDKEYDHESEEVSDELMANQYCAIPDDPIIQKEEDIAAKAKIGEDEDVSEEEKEKLRNILRKYNPILLHSGNALPECANNVVCDLNPKGRPIKMKPRRVQAIYTEKLFLLLKGLLETGIIQFSLSEWSSPIVIVLKKNGKDIRMCIDYVELNKRIELMVYTIPRIEDLLVLGEHLMWLVSLDMASGFWQVMMTERARKVISVHLSIRTF